MDSAQAQRLIVVASVVTIGSTVSGLTVYPPALAKSRKKQQEQEEKEVHEKKKKTTRQISTHRAIVGGLFAMAGCSVIAEFAPEAGVGLAALVAGGAFIYYGLPVISNYFTPEKEQNRK